MSIEEAADFWRNANNAQCHVGADSLAIGLDTLAKVTEAMGRNGMTFPLGTIVEWGCGGGANAVALADECDRYIGIDAVDERRVSFLDACPGAEFACVPMGAPEDAESLTASADLFLSTWCFNHFDSVRYGRRVLATAANMLGNGGLLLVQAVVTDSGDASDAVPYAVRWDRACAWSTPGWLDDLKSAGFAPQRIQRIDSTGLAWCSARKR